MTFTLPGEVVERQPPRNLAQSDVALFAHEYRRVLPSVTPVELAADFLPQGLLVRPRTGVLLPEGFQQGIPSGLSGLKARARAAGAWLRAPRVAWGDSAARPLVVTDEFSNGFFHWVGDALPKLLWLEPVLGELELVLPHYAHRFAYMTESLALWPQLKWRIAPGRGRLALGDCLVVPALAPTGNYRPNLMRALGEAWRLRLRSAAPWRQVYVSRAKAPWRKLRNEDEVWPVLRDRGYERVYLEDLPFLEQVRLAAETRTLVSNHGAGLSVAAFMVPGARLVEIRLAGDAHNNCYYALADSVGLDYRYVLAPAVSSAPNAHTADIEVGLDDLKKVLEALP